MSTLAIFLYGVVVSSLVFTALGLIAWGIVNERRDRLERDQGGERSAIQSPARAAHSGRVTN